MLRSCAWILAVLAMVLPAPAVAQMERFRPVTDERLANAHKEPENWFVFRRTWDQWGDSPLREITRDNVHQLRLVWSSGMNPGRNQQEPVVVDGIMFLIHPMSEIEALDARTGESIWRFRDKAAADARQSGAQGRSRSLAVYRDKVIFGTGDTRVIALDARTGKKVWEVDTLDPGLTRKYYDFSAGPAVGNGKVFIGNACEAAARPPCYVVGIDVETGKLVWRREAVAGAGDPAEAQASWGGVPKEGRLKASFWGTGSYDPKLNLTYWGSASASPYPEILKGTGKGEIKWTNSTLALKADTGEIAWAFQHLPRDNWDADHVAERTYVDGLRVQPDPQHVKWFNPDVAKGQTRDVLWAIGKIGVLWALDRKTGEFLWAKETIYQEYYLNIDGKGRATLNEAKIPKKVGEQVDICPGMRGGVLWQSRSYSPLTNALYLSVHQTCSSFKIVPTDSGLDWSKMYHMPGTNEQTGRLLAIDATSGKTLWSYQQRAPIWSVLTTAGGVLFVGDNYRNLMAFDQRTGKKL
jgi:alcohol dehydrogenase (cytochrome c)